MVYLVCLGHKRGEWINCWELTKGRRYIVGRSADADIQIRNLGLSRRHAAIRIGSEAAPSVRVEDLDSATGTFFGTSASVKAAKNSQWTLDHLNDATWQEHQRIAFGQVPHQFVIVDKKPPLKRHPCHSRSPDVPEALPSRAAPSEDCNNYGNAALGSEARKKKFLRLLGMKADKVEAAVCDSSITDITSHLREKDLEEQFIASTLRGRLNKSGLGR